MKVIVYHQSYGCDTGCCGHAIWKEDEFGNEFDFNFEFTHNYSGEETIEWAKRLVLLTYGEEHVKDLDWEHCFVSDD